MEAVILYAAPMQVSASSERLRPEAAVHLPLLIPDCFQCSIEDLQDERSQMGRPERGEPDLLHRLPGKLFYGRRHRVRVRQILGERDTQARRGFTAA